MTTLSNEPWYAREGCSPHYQGHVANETTGASVAVTYDDEGGHKANLIAAAPDLLRALKEVYNWRDAQGVRFPSYVMEKIEHAIAKAEGK